jgi:beta-glucosidase
MGGPATSNVLLGAVDPGGKLPVTFPADATHFPTYDPNCTDTSSTGNCPLYPGVVGPSPFLPGATTSFRFLTGMQVNGIYEGYRWYDEHDVTPLFPFGYGLSYTKFSYSKLNVAASADGGIDVSFRLRNVGIETGSDTPQVYLGPSPNLPTNISQADRKLVQFQRTTLGPGQAADLTLHSDAALALVLVHQRTTVGGRHGSTYRLRRTVLAAVPAAGHRQRHRLIDNQVAGSRRLARPRGCPTSLVTAP